MQKSSAAGPEAHLIEEWRGLVREALEARRHVVVFELARMLRERMDEHSLLAKNGAERGSPDWIHVESLSRLRQLVGGRFQNLKDRWVQAGFPLREHRGDRSGKPTLDPDGWMELVSWIGKNGYEARLAAEGVDWLFEIRELPRS